VIRVLLADDQALLRGTFRLLIDAQPDMEVVGEAATGREAADLCRAVRPDVVLMDIRMPEVDGITATGLIAGSARVLILTTFEVEEHVVDALRAGASGFLGKGVEPAALLDAIRVVAAGDALLSPAATKGLIARFLAAPSGACAARPERLDVLTPREREVMALIGQGLSNDEIAARLFVTPVTVKTHANRAMAKLGARDRAQLVVLAYETGLVRAGS
jgi:DNA-binding NarL/FixJ family response regulator